jgi:Uma2 family endonuclease
LSGGRIEGKMDPMAPADPARKKLTADDLLAIPEAERFHEILDGKLVRKATPSYEHGNAQSGVAGALKGPFQRPHGSGGPGGWWIATEVEVELANDQTVRPDVVGWRRERVPSRPSGSPVRERPDWICEVISPSNADEDTVRKFRIYQHAAIPHYWIIDPMAGTLTVHRWSSEGYLVALVARRGERVCAEPFDVLELSIGSLLGDDPSSNQT